MDKLVWKIIIFLGLAAIPFFVSAGTIEVSLNPQTPEPLEKVNVTLQGPLIDFDRSKIYWYVNNELHEYGIGKKTFSFNVGNVDEKTVLDVIITTEQGKRFDAQKIIIPSSIDLLWEAQTYTPPFYKGKALPTEKSPIKIVAILNTKDTDVKYTYSWGINNIFPLINYSGYNRKSFIMSGPEEGYSQKAVVSILSFDGSKKANKTIEIKSIKPKIVFYENCIFNSLCLNKALSNIQEINRDSNGLIIRAEPYFFSKTDVENNKLEYIWKINNQTLTSVGIQQRDINFTTPKEWAEQRKSLIQIDIKNTSIYAQNTNMQLWLKY